MTVLDPTGKMDIHRLKGDPDRIIVRLPLVGRAERWMRELQPLARGKGFWAEVRTFPEGSFLMVEVPADASREKTAELLDGALGLVDEARAVADAKLVPAVSEQHIRDWWESQTLSTQGGAAPE